MTRVLNDAGNAAIWVASAGIVVWIVQYTILTKGRNWRDIIGVTLVGEALVILAIYIPTLMALADPVRYAHFATTRWYLYLTVGIVVATAVFIVTRIATWEYIRRQRNPGTLSPVQRISELETEVAELRARLGETS